MLAIDVDDGSPSLEQLDAALVDICGDVSRAIYSTSGATADNLKWRAFVFLSDTITGAEYSDYQTALFDLLGEMGIKCDRALARAGQLIFLPNKVAHYQSKVTDGPMLPSVPSSIIERAKQNSDSAEMAHAAQRKLAEQRASERAKRSASCVAGDDVSLIDWFNSRYSVEQLFSEYGYESVGHRHDYISPQSTSKSVSVKVYDNRWHSLSGSDASSGLGQRTEFGCYGDAYDLCVHYEHGGDDRAAFREIGLEHRRLENASQQIGLHPMQTNIQTAEAQHSGAINGLDTAPIHGPMQSTPNGSDVEPQQPLEKLYQQDSDIFNHMVFLSGQDKFYNTKTGETFSKSALNTCHNRDVPKTFGSKGGETTPSASDYLMNDRCAPTVYDLMFVPSATPDDGANGIIMIDGVNYWNSYRDMRPDIPDDWESGHGWKACENHIRNILPDDADELIKWLAFNAQNIGQKISNAPVICGIQGDGKTTLAEILAAAIGGKNVKMISTQELMSNFNGYASGACVGVLEEVKIAGHNRHETMNRLKPLITNSTVSIVQKGRDGVQTPNTMNYIALTNHEDAMPLEDSDRRYACYRTKFETKEEMIAATGRDYWREIYDAINNHAGEILGWLCSVDLSDFNPHQAPAVSAYKAAMIEASRSNDEVNIREIIELGGNGVSEQVLSTKHLTALFRNTFGGSLQTKRLSKVLCDLGMHKAVFKMKWQGASIYVYVKDKDLLADTVGSRAKIRDALDKTHKEFPSPIYAQ